MTGKAAGGTFVLTDYDKVRKKMAAKKIALACTVCGSRNYTKPAGAATRTERLEIKKFCKYCKKHTLHRETK